MASIAAFALAGWGAAAVIAATPAAACAINPGTNTCAPDNLTLTDTSTRVAHTTNTITTCPSSPCFTATYTEDVYQDPNNTYCPNCLTWVLQVTNLQSSTDIIERVTVSDFKGFSTDIGVDTSATPPGMTSGTVSPINVERSGAPGSVLSWDFTNNNAIQPGQTSVVLELMTNAPQYKPGTVSLQDGTSVFGPGFAPLPEAWVPGLGLLGGAIAGGFVYRRRRQAR